MSAVAAGARAQNRAVMVMLFNTTRKSSQISTTDRTHARTGPDTRAQAHNHTQNSNTEHTNATKHTNAQILRTPKHEGLYRYGRRCGRHNLLLHRP